MAKKRKYTRKKIKKSLFQVKYFILFLFFIFLFHFLHVNISPYFEKINSKEVLVVYTQHTMNGWKLNENDKKYLQKNIQYFTENKQRKLLVLWETSKFGNQTESITDFLVNNEVWWGNIAQESAKKTSYGTVAYNFLQKQNLETAMTLSNIWNYYKNKNYFQTEKYSNISVKLYYDGLSDIFLGSVKNYYYFWKK